jgi:hypothetical protein
VTLSPDERKELPKMGDKLGRSWFCGLSFPTLLFKLTNVAYVRTCGGKNIKVSI